MSRVITGLDALLEDAPGWIRGRRLGLLCHQASVDSRLIHAKDLVSAAFPGQLTCLFSPQHGLYSEKQDNMIESADAIDPAAGLPVFSLYGKTREPVASQLSDMDILLVDLQDVGCRVYTYIWTMFLAMRACARHGKGLAVLDRPNPIGGLQVEGNLVAECCRSFVGMAPIPMRHGMTMGELALFLRDWASLDLELHVVSLRGWKRHMYFDQTGLPWVWPSPNMPTLDTALVYPGQVILEGTNLSEGRGTTRPFEVFGAPYLDPAWLITRAGDAGLKGMVLREQYFEPTFNKWKGKRCGGVQIHVVDRETFEPYLATLTLLSLISARYRQEFAWRPPPYEYEYDRLPADLITGDKRLREAVEQGAGREEIAASWAGQLEEFSERKRPFLLY